MANRPTVTPHRHLVAHQRQWDAMLPQLGAADRLAVDLEGDGLHNYPERVALIQIATTAGGILIVDPLGVRDLRALGAILATPATIKVMHAADYDVRCLDRDFGFRVRGLVDTAILAQYCGAERSGLANVLSDYLGTTLAKPSRLQRLNWSRRPLSEEALAYAAGDVAHLLALADRLNARLEALGRVAWAAEECRRQEAVRYTPPDPPESAFLQIRDARKMSGRQLAILRELYVFRAAEAHRTGRPPFRLVSDTTLAALARDPEAELQRWRRRGRSRTAIDESGLVRAIQLGQRSDPVTVPARSSANPWTPEARRRLSDLKRWRRREARRLGLATGLTWPAAHLESMALRPAEAPEEVDRGDPPWVREWQWRELGPSLADFRSGGADAAAPEDPA